MAIPPREVQLLVCPDPECGHIEPVNERAKIKGNPPCPRAHHRRNGNYRRLQRATVEITLEQKTRKRQLRRVA